MHAPFIIKPSSRQMQHNQVKTSVEERMRFVQGGHLYSLVSLSIESVRLVYLAIAYQGQCEAYSQMLLVLVSHSLLWTVVALVSIRAITHRSASVLLSLVGLTALLWLSRLLLYLGIYQSMLSVSPESPYCDYIYHPWVYCL